MAESSKRRQSSPGTESIPSKRFRMSSPTDLQGLQEIETRLLKGLSIVQPHAKECLKGTRISILAEVDIKTNDSDGANIILLNGAPGSGKSSISLTAKSQLRQQGRLVTYFRFDRNQTMTTTPTSLWCHVAYDLARLFPSVLPRILQQSRSYQVGLDSPMKIFTSLVEDTLLNIASPIDQPIVIIIDALDECGGRAGRQSPDRQILMKILQRWANLPKHFKLLITSRPEGDIMRALLYISTIIDIPSGRSITEDLESEAAINSSHDIHIFLEDRFRHIRERLRSLPLNWPGSETMRGMVHRAAGIFLWATTAANFIDFCVDPEDRIRRIMGDAYDSGFMEPLQTIYTLVLDMAFGDTFTSDLEVEILQSVLGAMVLAKRPLDEVEYMKLPITKTVTQLVLENIRDGLRSVTTPDGRRFIHKSFEDFLLSDKCPPRYAIRKDKSHYLLTRLCLMTMTKELRFNICDLETSCLKNADVPDITTKVANGISPLLSYSCLFFADHLVHIPFDFDEDLKRQVQEMMLDKLLFWFEAMSLLKEINRVSPSLLLLLKWLHTSPSDEFKEFLRDARRFIGAFGHPITQSAPHIYISALPFAPENSFVAKRFLRYFPSILALSTGKPAIWSSNIFTSEHHKDTVNCVAFSADEEYFVTGSDDKTICIFDSETGNLISGPFNCDDCVYSVCFDPSGSQVWTGHGDGRVIGWDMETGDKQLVIHPQHSYWYLDPGAFNCRFIGSQKIISAGKTISLWNGETGRCEQDCDWRDGAFQKRSATSISPDGCYIALVTGRRGTNIRIWKMVDGNEIQRPVDSRHHFEHSQPISALSFSVDSKFAVSGSADGTVIIWDVSTGDADRPPLRTGIGWVSAVAYSPKNHLLASASGTVAVWDPMTYQLLGCLEGHTSMIRDIALSRDGQRVLTASCDKTVRMWDLGWGCHVFATNVDQAHASEVRDVAFSPCGRKLASLDSCSIQGWYTNTGNCFFRCDTRDGYKKLIFSPDGIHVVAYSCEWGVIGVWNANTGALVSRFEDHGADHVAFRPTDGVLVLCSDNGVVYTWSIENDVAQIIAKLPSIVALSHDGLTGIVYDRQRSPRHYIWSTTTHQPLPLVLADDENVSDIPRAYSPSGQFFASSSNVDQLKSTLRVWDMRTGELAARFSIDNDVRCLAFSSNNRDIASSNSSQIWIFDARSGQLTSGPWGGHTDDISTLAFSPDGKSLASGAKDSQVRVWDVPGMLADSQLSLRDGRVWTLTEDGWAQDVGGKLLFWVPRSHRTRLVWPHSVPLGGGGTGTELDLSKFRYGECWAECYSGCY